MAAVTKPTDPALFATSGPTSVPAPGRIADGWKGPAAPDLDGDIPPAEEFNWKWLLDGNWNAWVQAHAAARLATLDDAVEAKGQGWLTAGTSFNFEDVDRAIVGDRANFLITGRTATELRADGEYVFQIAADELETLERDVSSKTVRYTSSEAIGRFATAGVDLYVTDAVGGSRRIHHISRSTFGLVSVLVLPVGQDPVAICADRADIYVARDNFDVDRHDLDLSANPWGAPYNHGSAINDLATDGELVFVAGEDAGGGGTNHLVALRSLNGSTVWTLTLPGGVNGRATSVEADGRFVWVTSFDGASGDSTLTKVSRATGAVVTSRTFTALELVDIAVDVELVAVVAFDAGTNNVFVMDRIHLADLGARDYDGAAAQRPTTIATDGSRIYLGGEVGPLDGEAQWIARGTTPSTWVVDDLSDTGALLVSPNLRYSNVFTPGER